MRSLGRCLNLCASLQVLTFGSLVMSDAACTALFATLASGALPQLKELDLTRNQIGDEGLESFSAALVSGEIAKLEKLMLRGNQIGDEGMKSFSTALASGAMANLKTLHKSGNPGDTTAVKETCKARGISGM
jgi:Ran GTPase-activating protein (RanGAP) involved in mRNA processing and transport